MFEDVELSADLLKEVVVVDNETGFPDLTDLLKFYKVSKSATKTGFPPMSATLELQKSIMTASFLTLSLFLEKL